MNDWAILEAKVSRKAKIGMAVAFVLLVVAAICFFTRGKESEVQVSYLRLSSSGPNRVLFAITNTSKHYLHYDVFPVAVANGVPVRTRGFLGGSAGAIFPTNDTVVGIDVPAFASWSTVVLYTDSSYGALALSKRYQLAQWARSHNWWRLSQWLEPKLSGRIAYGPIMHGNQPVPAVPK